MEGSPAGRGGHGAAVLAALKSKQKRPGVGGARREGGYVPAGHSHQLAQDPSPTQNVPLHPELPKHKGGTITPPAQQQNWLNEDFFNQEVVRRMNYLDVVTLPATSLDTSSDITKRLHVSNIPFYYREEHLVHLFEQFGDVIEAEIIYHHRGSKGFGFVTMAREEDADTAMATLHWSVVEGRVIDVNLANKKTIVSSRTQDLPSMGSTIVWRKTDRPPAVLSYPTVSPLVMVEAQIRLAEAQLAVLQMQQTMLHDQHKEDNTGASEGVISDVDSGHF